MITDVVTIKIKIKNKDLTFEEKADLIKSNLISLVHQLENTKGNIQQFKGNDVDSSIEYVHLKHKTANCEECSGSGFSGQGTGYDSVCDKCGGKGEYLI